MKQILLKNHFQNIEQRRAIFADLVAIVEADGSVSEIENGWLGLVKKQLEL